jgi:hypothetical protein
LFGVGHVERLLGRWGRSSLRGGRLGFLVRLVVRIACSRGERNREHSLTVGAPQENDILHQPNAGDARGFTEVTRREWLVEKA